MICKEYDAYESKHIQDILVNLYNGTHYVAILIYTGIGGNEWKEER